MSQINVQNLTFGYEGSLENVFENVSFVLDTDWKLGLIGRNGKGKTTFLKLLVGQYDYQGTISKNVDIDYFPYGIKDKNEITLDIILSIAPNAEDWEIIKELNLLNTTADILYRPYNTLSGGEQVKIQLVALFLKQDNFLLIDEPTNHLDKEARDSIINYIKNKKGFIVVSHDRYFLDNVCDHIISINNANIDIQKGNYSSWKENMDRQNSFEQMQNEKINRDISRLEVAKKSTSNWSDSVESTKVGVRVSGLRPDTGYIGHQAAKMMKRSKVIEARIEKAIDEKKNLLNNVDRQDNLTIKPLTNKRNPIMILEDVQAVYDGVEIFEPVSFDICNGDRIALIGKNGAGKSSIVKLILNESKMDFKGKIRRPETLKISYVSQNTDYLKGNLKDFAKACDIDESIFKAMLAKMGLDRIELDKNIESMSEGQKKKVLIAKSITESADIYVWDEPLNYIDILTREQIEEAILKYMPTLVFVEHDDTFVQKIATKRIVITRKED